MKAWLGILVISDKQGLLNAFENMLLHRNDSRLWDSDQNKSMRGVNIFGQEYVYTSLFFNDFNERAFYKGALGGINGFIKAASRYSNIKMAKCWNDDLLPNGTPVKAAVLEFSEVVE